MAKLVTIKLPDGTQLEAETSAEAGPRNVARGKSDEIDLAAELKRVEAAAGLVIETFRRVAPDECEVELGIKLGGKVGVILAEGTAEASFRVKLKWVNKP
jgi:hypothetical protein